MWTSRPLLTVLLVLGLAGGAARSDEQRAPQAEDPDPGFLEFLGSVDGLAEANPDYLAQASSPRPGQPVRDPAKPPPPPAPSAPGVKNNE